MTDVKFGKMQMLLNGQEVKSGAPTTFYLSSV